MIINKNYFIYFIFLVLWSIKNLPIFYPITNLNFQGSLVYAHDLVIFYLIINFFVIQKFTLLKLSNTFLFLIFYSILIVIISVILKGPNDIFSDLRLYVYFIFFLYFFNYMSLENIKNYLDHIIFISFILLLYSFLVRYSQYGLSFPKKSLLFRYDAFYLVAFISCFLQLILRTVKFRYFLTISLFLFFYSLEGVRAILIVYASIVFTYIILFNRSRYLLIFVSTILYMFFLKNEIYEYFIQPIINLDGTLLVRVMAWKEITSRIYENLLFGHGLGSSLAINKYFYTETGGAFIGTPHNVFLSMLYLTGIFGILPFIFINFKILFFHSYNINKNHNLFLKSILIFLLIYFSLQPLGPDFYVTFWMIYSFIYSLQRKINHE